MTGVAVSKATEWVAALGVPVAALSADSRAVDADTAFLAYPGERDDGRRYIGSAVAAGAVGVFWEAEDFGWRGQWQVPNVAVPNLRAQCGAIADVVYGAPSARLRVAAITGTNGKTTVSHLTAQLLQCAGIKSGVVGTLGAGVFADAITAVNNTTPAAEQLHGWLRRFADADCGAAVVEASSHGIVQGRLNGVRLAAAVFTNAAQDHLDYHGDLESYWQAKARLFALPDVEVAILNADDAFCRRLAPTLRQPVLLYGRDGGDLRLLDLQARADGWVLEVDGALGRRALTLPLDGEHNVYNFLAAALTALSLGMEAEAVADAVQTLTLPAGRMQQVLDAPAVYVDYAHTPAAMAAVLAAARQRIENIKGAGKLITVFGAGGGRDVDKRAEMGRIAASFADAVIVTDDNPRDEDAAAIRATLCHHALAAAAGGTDDISDIADRHEAIVAALDRAAPADVVLILGKGHETTQTVGGASVPFSDVAVVRQWQQRLQRKKGEQQ